MTAHPPVVREFVKQFALNYLDGLRKSKQMEGKYRRLQAQVKRVTTQELDRVSSKFTDELLSRVTTEELDSLDDALLKECLLRALDDDHASA